MLNNKPIALVLAGDGLNCEIETNEILNEVGFDSQVVHINSLLKNSKKYFEKLNLMVIPGGFSFGDELGSGKILSLKIKHSLQDSLKHYLNSGGALLGICNGFQVMTQLGIFDDDFESKTVLTHNDCGHFLNRWVGLELIGDSIFTKTLKENGIQKIELPIRHGEGRLLIMNLAGAERAYKNGLCVLKYSEDINGSWNQVAAISAYEGRVMGMMPHPEAFWCSELHPNKNIEGYPLGTEFFKSAFLSIQKQRGLK